MILNPCFIAAVQTCKFLAPHSRNSTASRHVVMPPVAEIGMSTALAISATHRKRDGLDGRAG